jgi:hypothetical protein
VIRQHGLIYGGLVIDSHNPRALAAFWCAVFGYRMLEEGRPCRDRSRRTHP